MFASINEEFRIDIKVPSPFKPRFRKFMTGSFPLRIGIISIVNRYHFGSGDHFGGDSGLFRWRRSFQWWGSFRWRYRPFVKGVPAIWNVAKFTGKFTSCVIISFVQIIVIVNDSHPSHNELSVQHENFALIH